MLTAAIYMQRRWIYIRGKPGKHSIPLIFFFFSFSEVYAILAPSRCLSKQFCGIIYLFSFQAPTSNNSFRFSQVYSHMGEGKARPTQLRTITPNSFELNHSLLENLYIVAPEWLHIQPLALSLFDTQKDVCHQW